MSVTFSTVFNEYFTSRNGVKSIAKLGVNLYDGLKFFEMTQQAENFSKFAGVCRTVKSFLVLSDIHKKVADFYKLYSQNRKIESLGKGSEVTIHLCEGVKFFRSVGLFQSSIEQLAIVDVVLNVAGLIKGGVGFCGRSARGQSSEVSFKLEVPKVDWGNRRIDYLQKEVVRGTRPKIKEDGIHAFLRTVVNIGYLAKAILGIAVFYGLLASASGVGLLVSTLLTVAGIFEHFVKKLYIEPANWAAISLPPSGV